MLDALVFADQPRAGDRPVVGALAAHVDLAAVELLAERLEALDRLGLQPAIGQFLDAVGEPAFEEAAIVGRRLALEEIAPLLLQGGEGAVFRAANRARTVSVIRRSPFWEVGMTALVAETVERTFSAVGRDWTGLPGPEARMRPQRWYGGPTPFMRHLASVERLTRDIEWLLRL